MASLVVGYDGSRCPQAALDTTLDLANRLDHEVIIVFGYEQAATARSQGAP